MLEEDMEVIDDDTWDAEEEVKPHNEIVGETTTEYDNAQWTCYDDYIEGDNNTHKQNKTKQTKQTQTHNTQTQQNTTKHTKQTKQN